MLRKTNWLCFSGSTEPANHDNGVIYHLHIPLLHLHHGKSRKLVLHHRQLVLNCEVRKFEEKEKNCQRTFSFVIVIIITLVSRSTYLDVSTPSPPSSSPSPPSSSPSPPSSSSPLGQSRRTAGKA